MLKINNLNKYYFKKKSNELHVLKDINLEFKEKGFYFLLGPSGSGKSTLLNCLGLLDSFDEGSITIEDKEIKKYRKVDDIRNNYFGYVFQNYLLNEEISVYDNLALVLKLINYKGDYNKRINEVLASVNMEKYIKRKAKDLSGGQKQRIGIARCLIKTPKIILMDEPTGNLDEKNSIQVMELAAKMAERCLVICVSHAENLAYAYADTIIRLKDGEITSINENKDKHHLSVNDLNHIYLKDYDHQNVNNINIYTNTCIPNLNIIIDHNKVFIEGNNNNIEVINETSNIKLLDEHKKEEEIKELNLDISPIEVKESKHVLRFFELFKKAFKTKYKKYMTIAFIINSIIFAFGIPFLSNLDSINVENVIETNSNVYNLPTSSNATGIKNVLKPEDALLSSYNTYLTNLEVPASLEVEAPTLNASYAPKEEHYKFKKGNYSDNIFDIYIDEIIATRIINKPDFKRFGIDSFDTLIGKEINYQFDSSVKGKIAGIVTTHEPSIYVDERLLSFNENIIPSSYDFFYEGSKVTLNDDEYLVNEKYADISHGLKHIVGTFKSDYDFKYIANDKTANAYFLNNDPSIKLYTNDISYYEDTLETSFQSYYELEVEEYYYIKNMSIITSSIFLIVTLAISLIFLYFIMQSSLIHRIKEIGINRSIGVKKLDIYKIFASEISAIVIKYSLPGYLLTVLMSLYLHNGGLIPEYNLLFVPIGMIVYFILSIVIGLIPVSRLMKKTPSEINKKYDI